MTDALTKSRRASFRDEALPHLDAVFGFAIRLTKSREDAHDLVQETYMRAYRSWEQYTPGSSCRSWLFTIARNAFLRNRERIKRLEKIVEEQQPTQGRNADPGSAIWSAVADTDPEGRFFDSIVDQSVSDAIDTLPEDFRTAVVLSDLEDMSYAEIAEVMGVPVGTVKSRLFRGRRELQKALYAYATEMGYVRRTMEDL